MRKAVVWGLSLSLLWGVALLWGQAARSGKKPPSQYDKSVTGAFFEDVRKARGEGAPGGGRPVAATNTVGSTGQPMPMAVGGVAGWAKIISPEVLEDLIKSAPGEIGDKVDNESKFNTGHRDIRKLYSLLAVTFNVIAQYDGDVRFKDKAPGLRDQIARSARNAKVFSTGAWKEAQQRNRDLQEIVRGGSVQLPDEVEQLSDFSKIADRPELMKRLDDAVEKGITKMAADDAGFKANKDKILREAQIVAMIARAIQDPTYEYGTDDGYRAYAQQLEANALEVAEGTRQGNYKMAGTAIGEIRKACSECHGDFKQ